MTYAERIDHGLNRFHNGHFQNTPNIKTFFGCAYSGILVALKIVTVHGEFPETSVRDVFPFHHTSISFSGGQGYCITLAVKCSGKSSCLQNHQFNKITRVKPIVESSHPYCQIPDEFDQFQDIFARERTSSPFGKFLLPYQAIGELHR